MRDSFGVFEDRRARQIMSSVLIDDDVHTTILDYIPQYLKQIIIQ